MKKKLISVFLSILFVLPIFGSLYVYAAPPTDPEAYTNVGYESADEKLADMSLAASNGNLELWINELSGEIGIKDVVSGEIILSNPISVSDVEKGTAKSVPRNRYLSTLKIYYYSRSASTTQMKDYCSYADSAYYGQMTINKDRAAEGIIEVTYEMGKKETLLPLALYKDDLEAIVKMLADAYEADSTQKLANTVAKGMARQYDLSADGMVYMIKGSSPLKNRNNIIEALTLYTDLTLDDLHAMYEKVGFDYLTGLINYTSEDGTVRYEDKNIGVGFETPIVATIVYTLEGDSFTAEVDCSKITYDSDNYYLSSISILPYMNTAKYGQDTGYSLVPDGSGTLVRYEVLAEDGVTDNISTRIYGSDYASYVLTIKNQERTTLPVFGNVINTAGAGRGFFGIVENGDAMASIVSENGNDGKTGGTYFNSVYPSFSLTTNDTYDLAESFSSGTTASKAIGVTSKQPYGGLCKVRYYMLTPKQVAEEKGITNYYDTTYIGMAFCYRDYLTKKGSITKKTSKTNSTKVFFELFGAMDVEEKILTFPVTVSRALTTFDDVIEMHKYFYNLGITNSTFILTGFTNGGLNTRKGYPTYLKWQSSVGGSDGYEKLLEYSKENNFTIAPNVDFVYSSGLEMFSGFGYKSTAAKTLDQRYTTKRAYDASMQMFQRRGGVVISAGSYELAYTKFVKSASKYEIPTLATLTLGSDLNSDFDEKTGYLYREDNKDYTVNLLQLLTGEKKLEKVSSSYKLILGGTNSYSIHYASEIVGASLDSSRLLNTSESIPFLGMVLHGSIDFAGNPINMEGDDEYMYLKALENGACLYYTLAMNNVQLLKEDEKLNSYYSIRYDTWKNKIAKLYRDYNSVMASKQDQYIVDHEFINAKDGYEVSRTVDNLPLNNSRIVRVEYENGEGFLLNYNSFEVRVVYGGVEYTIKPLYYATYGMD